VSLLEDEFPLKVQDPERYLRPPAELVVRVRLPGAPRRFVKGRLAVEVVAGPFLDIAVVVVADDHAVDAGPRQARPVQQAEPGALDLATVLVLRLPDVELLRGQDRLAVLSEVAALDLVVVSVELRVPAGDAFLRAPAVAFVVEEGGRERVAAPVVGT